MVVNDDSNDFTLVVFPVVCQRDLKWDNKKVKESREMMVRRNEYDQDVYQNKEISSDMELATINIIDLGENENEYTRKEENARSGDRAGPEIFGGPMQTFKMGLK